MSQPQGLAPQSSFGSQSLGSTGLTAGLLTSALGQAIAASNASLMSAANPSTLGASSDTMSTNSQLSNALTKLAIAQHQQQQVQQQQQAQQAAAANAMMQAAASGSSNLLPSIASNMSLSGLRSTSVASSVLSAVPLAPHLEPIPSNAPTFASGSTTASGGSKVRACSLHR
jgi:hypothetical protein